jgi:hypothetical protein
VTLDMAPRDAGAEVRFILVHGLSAHGADATFRPNGAHDSLAAPLQVPEVEAHDVELQRPAAVSGVKRAIAVGEGDPLDHHLGRLDHELARIASLPAPRRSPDSGMLS